MAGGVQWLSLQGVSLETEGKPQEASRTYASMLPYLSNLSSTFASTLEHQSWTEKVLARHCILSSRYVKAIVAQPQELLSVTSPTPPGSLLAPFRAFADHYKKSSSRNASHDSSQGRVWQAYYDTLSVLVQHGIVQPIFTNKMHQAAELKKVQAMYEGTLLKEVKFPRADQANSQIESWVDQVMANWRILCGYTWQDSELEEGGKATMGHVVLDVGTPQRSWQFL